MKHTRPLKPENPRVYECHIGISSQEEKVNTYEQVLKETRRTSNITFLNDSNELFINNDKEDMRVNLEMLYYEGHGGLNDKPEHRPSGAYIFR